MNKTGYLKVEVKSDKDGRCIAKQIDRDHEFYVDPANLTLTKDIVDLLDKEMSEDKAISYLMQSGWLAKHERETHDAANKDLSDENERLKRRVGDYTLQIEHLLAEIKVERASLKAYKEQLVNLPPVQPNHNADVSKKEIVQCKDCKFAHMTVDGECKYCDIWFPDEKTYMPGDYYCASAERRGDPDDND